MSESQRKLENNLVSESQYQSYENKEDINQQGEQALQKHNTEDSISQDEGYDKQNNNIKQQEEQEEFSNENNYSQKQIKLKGRNFQYCDEKEIYKYINKVISHSPESQQQEQQININYILKKQNSLIAIIDFVSVDDKTKFEEAFNNQENKSKSKKVKIFSSGLHENQFKDRGAKTQKQILNEMAKQKQIIIPTEQQIQQEMDISLKERMFPLLDIPYEQQLEEKKQILTQILQNWTCQARKLAGGNRLSWPQWISNDIPCQIAKVIGSDPQHQLRYRNKAEFTVGLDIYGTVKVGYSRGNLKKGIQLVEGARNNPLITDEQSIIAEKLEEIIQKHIIKYPFFDKFTYKGFWRNLIIRQSQKTKQILVTFIFNDLSLQDKQQELQFIIQQIKETFIDKMNLKINDSCIVSMGYSIQNHKNDSVSTTDPVYSILGDAGKDYYEEDILGNRFVISPFSFLQVNTPQCEKLYTLIGEIINNEGQQELKQDTIFLDICSGIGTIGICLAKDCKEVLGMEMVKQACDNAELNKKINGITNYSVFCNKVEDIINKAVKPYQQEKCNIIGVVDPPRPGLHKSVVQSLRTCKGLDHLIYVACNPSAVIENLNYLCLPSNKNTRPGPPFEPIKSYIVDLFPQTKHFEAIFYLRRIKY